MNSVIDKVDLLYREKARYEVDRSPAYDRDVYYGNAYVEDKKTVDQELQEALKNAYEDNRFGQYGSTDEDVGYVVRRKQDAEANNIFPRPRALRARVAEEYKRILNLCNAHGFRFLNTPQHAKKVNKVSVLEVKYRKRSYGIELCLKIVIDSIDRYGNYDMDIKYGIPLATGMDKDSPVSFNVVTEEEYNRDFEKVLTNDMPTI